MSQTAPIIPVIDERLACPPTAPSDHKMKVEQYNELPRIEDTIPSLFSDPQSL